MSESGTKVRNLIRAARDSIAARDNAPALAHQIMTRMWDVVSGDEDVLKLLVGRGLNGEIRAFLSRHHSDDEDGAAAEVRAQQLAMWPDETSRTYVEQINRERIWVPSRRDFVELVPDALTPEEIVEAGEHLIQHGADCVRRGRLLLRLAELTPA